LIPPICPRSSAINANFANTHSGLNVVGLRNGAGEDCISHIELREDRSMSVAVGDNAFAIGTKSGRILLYWQSTCQERMTLEHREIVKVLAIDNRHQLASA
jgi:DNA-binding IclR family transcriptional regulator